MKFRYGNLAHSCSTAKAFIAPPAETSRRSQQLSSTPVSSSSCLAGLGRRMPDYTLRYRDTLAYDMAIQFFLTIRALHNSLFGFKSKCALQSTNVLRGNPGKLHHLTWYKFTIMPLCKLRVSCMHVYTVNSCTVNNIRQNCSSYVTTECRVTTVLEFLDSTQMDSDCQNSSLSFTGYTSNKNRRTGLHFNVSLTT